MRKKVGTKIIIKERIKMPSTKREALIKLRNLEKKNKDKYFRPVIIDKTDIYPRGNSKRYGFHNINVEFQPKKRVFKDSDLTIKVKIKNQPNVKSGKKYIRINKNMTNKQFLLGDFDGDNIYNIDDTLPFTKSTKTVEESKLSVVIKHSTKLNKMKSKSTKSIITDFRKLIKLTKTKPKKLKSNTPYRTKSPISIISKAYNRGLNEVNDMIGISYLGNNYKDLKTLEHEISKWTDVKKIKDYYKNPKADGYKAIHIKAVDKKTGELFEIQLKTKRTKRISEINHTLYKEGKQSRVEFVKLMDISIQADNGNKKAIFYIDKLTDANIKKLLSKK